MTEISRAAQVANLASEIVSVKDFGAVGDGVTDDTVAIQAAIDAADNVIIDTNSVFSVINLRGSTTVTIDNELMSSSVDCVRLTGIFGTVVRFTGKGKISGDSLTDNQSGVVLEDCVNCKIIDPFLEGFLNKGFDIKGNTSDCSLIKPRVRGSTGSSGAGVSIFGAGCQRNTVYQADCSFNRIGITINGGQYNHILHPVANSCTSSGVSIDGIISGTGDGGFYNTIDHPICNNGTDATKGGVFIGNGSSYNQLIHPICNNNTGSGIRFSGGAGFTNDYNSIIDPVCNNNSANGITLSFCPNMSIINPTCKSNTGRGISNTDCDGLSITGGVVSDNTTDGILHQSPNTNTKGVLVVNNGADGIETAFGGTLGVSDCVVSDCRVSGNVGLDLKLAGSTKAYNCRGFVTDNKGSDTKADGQTIAHGLSSTPSVVIANGSVAGETVAVTAVSSTTFTVSIKDSAGLAGSSQTVYWQASIY